MPNWCENHLTVDGSKDEVARFVKQAEGQDSLLKFDNFVPMPKTKENTEGGGWYDWCIEHWGTKWEAREVDRAVSEDGINATYTFDTAWAPPIEWLEAVASQYPTLRFSLQYVESGMGFHGEAKGEGGRVTDDCRDLEEVDIQ